MQKLYLPPQNVTIKEGDNVKRIFDPVRKKWLKLTAEEWVRQNILQFLVSQRGYPIGLIAIEYAFELNYGKKYRADIVVFNTFQVPILVVECKAKYVKIDENTISQIAKYNTHLKAKNLFVTNGDKHYFMQTTDFVNYKYLNDIPMYIDITD